MGLHTFQDQDQQQEDTQDESVVNQFSLKSFIEMVYQNQPFEANGNEDIELQIILCEMLKEVTFPEECCSYYNSFFSQFLTHFFFVLIIVV